MTRPHVQWWPDPESVQILAAYRRRREPIRDILRRALRLLAQADGILDHRGKIRDGKRP